MERHRHRRGRHPPVPCSRVARCCSLLRVARMPGPLFVQPCPKTGAALQCFACGPVQADPGRGVANAFGRCSPPGGLAHWHGPRPVGQAAWGRAGCAGLAGLQGRLRPANPSLSLPLPSGSGPSGGASLRQPNAAGRGPRRGPRTLHAPRTHSGLIARRKLAFLFIRCATNWGVEPHVNEPPWDLSLLGK